MTRGKIAVVTPKGKILMSAEFNGDMYFDGHGQDVYDDLECAETVEEYKEFVERFNRDNFGYTDRNLFYDCDDSFLDMQDDYFGKWFSDYVYIKNLSLKPVVFIDANGKKIQLDTDTTAVFNFGEFVACYAEDLETKNFIDRLNAMKNNSSCEPEALYSDILDMCYDYEKDHRYICLTDCFFEQDFVDEEQIQEIIKEKTATLSSLRDFLNDTYDADIYKIDCYGNLANVNYDDLEYLIDDIVYRLENEITVPLAKRQEAYL